MGRVKKYSDWLKADTIARIKSPIPIVDIPQIQVWDGTQVISVAEESLSPDVVRDSVDNMPLFAYTEYGGRYYRPSTLASIGVVECSSCNNIATTNHLISGKCAYCTKLVEFINVKTSPVNGWKKFGSYPYAGIEIELEFPIATSSETLFQETVRGAEWYMPMVYTKDVSLKNGIELNTHMMGLDYIKTNGELFAHCINRLKQVGASNIAYTGDETAGLHVHLDMDAFSTRWQNEFNKWLKLHKRFCLSISGRSERKFDHWSWVHYNYIGPRNKNTWECRGFSSSVVLKNPDALQHIVAWVHTLAWLTRNPVGLLGTVRAAFIDAGFGDSADFWETNGAVGLDDAGLDAIRRPLQSDDMRYQRVTARGIPHEWFVTFVYDNYVTIARFGETERSAGLEEITWLDKPIKIYYSRDELIDQSTPLPIPVPF